MDLIQILRSRIESLQLGDYTPGLRAVLLHVQVASGHLTRGAATGDDTAFTDAIYRTNQAFEGSLKEAYRVLAGKDPSKVRPFDIENFFQGKSVLRPRVLAQFSTYRTEWRNPSAHDYKLDFDEDEALLAIVSVCAFAIVLIDQIVEKVNFEKARSAAAPPSPTNEPTRPFFDAAVDALLKFRFQPATSEAGQSPREVEILGAIAGHLNAVVPGVKVSTESPLGPDLSLHADMILESGDERILVELKRGRAASKEQSGIMQLSRYIAVSGIKNAILYMLDDKNSGEMICESRPLLGADARVVIIRPARAVPPSET